LSKDEFNKKLDALNMDMSAIKSDLSKTNSTLTSILVATNTTPGVIVNNAPNTGFYPHSVDPNPPSGTIPPISSPSGQICKIGENNCVVDQYGYFSNLPYIKINEPTTNNQQIPIGEITFDARKQTPWGYKILPREYSTSFVLASDTAGHKTAYAKMSIKPNDGSGKSYDLPETQVQYYEKLPGAEFFWWNPQVMLGIGAGASSKPAFAYGPDLQLFIMGYGKYKIAPEWKFIGLGVGYDINNANYNLAISPFAYKLGNEDSIIRNLHIKPTVSVGIDGKVSVMIGFGLSL